MNDSDSAHFERMLRQQGLWMKRASEGANSLMRAVSNSLYFSEMHYETLQKRVLEYYMAHQGSSDLVFLELQDEESCMLFLQNPSLPEFEFVNLELLARVIDARIKLYFFEKRVLSCNNVYRSSKQKVRILKLFGNHYASVLPVEYEDKYTFAQNVALSLVDHALGNSPLAIKNHNRSQFINYEYENWKLLSGMTQEFIKSLTIDYRRNFYTQWSTSTINKYDSSSVSDGNSQGLSSGDSVGSIIVSIMEQRRRTNYLHQKNGSMERKYNLQTNTSDQWSTKRHEGKPKKNSINERVVSIPQVQSESIYSAYQEMDTGFQTFSEKICGNDTNLKKSVPIFELNFIFGVGSNNKPVSNSALTHLPANVDNSTIMRQLNIHEEEDERENFHPAFERINQLIAYDDDHFLDELIDKTTCSVHGQQRLSSTYSLGSEINQTSFHSKDLPRCNLRQLSSFGHQSHSAYHRILPQESREDRPKRSNLRDRLKDKKIEEFKVGSSITVTPCHSFTTPYSGNSSAKPPHEFTTTFFQLEKPVVLCPEPNGRKLYTPPSNNLATPPTNAKSKTKQKYRETQSESYYSGTLKFFDEKNGFGFMTVSDQSAAYDVFVYRNEFKRAKVGIDVIRQVKAGALLTFSFQIATYMGKSNECKKAINIRLVDIALPSDSK